MTTLSNSSVSKNSIYRTTITCTKDIKDHWKYVGKIFYRQGPTKMVHEVYGKDLKDLEIKMKEYMIICLNK